MSEVDEEITEGGEDRDEALQASWRSEALHRPLPFSQRHRGILSLVVQAFVRPVFDGRHHLSLGCSVGAQLVGDHALLLQQPPEQALGGLGVATVLDDLVEHIAILS